MKKMRNTCLKWVWREFEEKNWPCEHTLHEHYTLREHERKSILNIIKIKTIITYLSKYKDLLRRHIYWSKKNLCKKKKIFDKNKQEQIMSFLESLFITKQTKTNIPFAQRNLHQVFVDWHWRRCWQNKVLYYSLVLYQHIFW
jgi:predicted AlkP superfamily pyrophosphatase or phosphodiesterase